MNYLKGNQRRVKEIELLRWVLYFLIRPLKTKGKWILSFQGHTLTNNSWLTLFTNLHESCGHCHSYLSVILHS
jgi:hypothetical protein